MITYVLGILLAITTSFVGVFSFDFFKHRKQLENNSWAKIIGIGIFTNFFDALGIGSFATGTALLKVFKQTEDKLIPGILNVAYTIPVVMEAFIFIKVIEIEPVTLVSMLCSATVGAYFGAGIVSKLPEKTIQITMGVALFITASLMIAGQLNLLPGGGEEIGLVGGKLVFAVVANFILGALMTAGIGLYAPCMALVYFLGMSPRVAFPIMMGSCAFLMPVASMKFIKEGAYDRKASMGITVSGIVGIVFAVYLVKTLPLHILKWIVVAVIYYTSVTMLQSAFKKNKINDKIDNERAV